MSKGGTHTLFGKKPKDDGHREIGNGAIIGGLTDWDIKHPRVYCPKANDIVSAGHTSAGMRCSHCGKIY